MSFDGCATLLAMRSGTFDCKPWAKNASGVVVSKPYHETYQIWQKLLVYHLEVGVIIGGNTPCNNLPSPSVEYEYGSLVRSS